MCINGNGMGLDPSMKQSFEAGPLEIARNASRA